MSAPNAAPALTALAKQCVAAPDDGDARLDLAAALQRAGRRDVAAVVGGPTGRDVARFAADAGADLLFVAERLTGRGGWDDRDPAQFAAVFALVVRRNAALLAATDQTAGAIADVQAAIRRGLDDIRQATGSAPADALAAACRRLLAVNEALMEMSRAAGPLHGMAEAQRAAG